MILYDNETKVDYLNNESIANSIIDLVKERPDNPITVGVHGDWGAGKSSVLEMIEAGLADNSDEILCLKFNSWRFQGFEDAKIALIEGIVTELIANRSCLRQASEEIKDIFERINWLKVAKKGGGLAFTALTGVPTVDHMMSAIDKIGSIISDQSNYTPDKLSTVIDDTKQYLKEPPSDKNIPTEIAEFHKAFQELLDKAKVKQLVVLIDDLDRCLPETAIDTLEAVRLFLFTKRTAFVVAADEAMIEYAVRRHFPDLPETSSSQSYARSYLEKLIQVPFRIPPLGETETRIYVMLLFVSSVISTDSAEFKALLETAKEKLRRPWLGEPLSNLDISKILGNKTNQVNNALILSDQLGPILAAGSKGNPRQIKRFLNTLILRHNSAQARGFGDEIKLPVLAKLMLLERFIPSVFDQIATSATASVNGQSIDLTRLESIQSMGNSDIESNIENHILLSEWLKSPMLTDWVTVKPLIGEEDLRPYLFISKDRKDYFGGNSALGHLSTIAEQLFGTKMMVQGLKKDIQKLADPEASQIFEIIRQRIIGSAKFNDKPKGIDGLLLLVACHPMLKPMIFDFLESLPTNELGAWVCTGWNVVLNSTDDKIRYKSILNNWIQSGSDLLKITAQVTLKTMENK